MEVTMIFEKIQSWLNQGLSLFQQKSMELTQEVMIPLIIIAVIGLLFCFLGLKMVRIWAGLLGLSVGLLGGAFAADYFGAGATVSWIIGLAVGLILAALAVKFYVAGVMIVAWGMGISVGMYFIKPVDWTGVLICVGIGLVLGLIALKFAEPVIMILTSIYGGFAGGQAVGAMISAENGTLKLVIIAVLIVLGVIVQFLLESKRKKRLHLKKAEEIRSRHSTANEVDKARAMIDDLDGKKPVRKKESADEIKNASEDDMVILDLDENKK